MRNVNFAFKVLSSCDLRPNLNWFGFANRKHNIIIKQKSLKNFLHITLIESNDKFSSSRTWKSFLATTNTIKIVL